MTSNKIRVLVVDDSAVIREMVSDFIAATSDIEVAGTAADGEEALTVFDQVRPDLVTLDIQMPKMDGLQTLDAMLRRRPVPVIMVSSQTRLGADITLEALDRGALDYVAKPDGLHNAQECLRDGLLGKIRSLSGTDVRLVLDIRKKRAQRRAARKAQRAAGKVKPTTPGIAETDLADKLIAIGISTGGPPALAALFESIYPPTPPIVVVQHMPRDFTGAFALRLDSLSPLSIKEAETGDELLPNCAYVAPGARHITVRKAGAVGKILLRDGDPVSGHRPSADVLMQSAARTYGDRCLGVIMTGMGRDGCDGCAAIRAEGGFVLGQDEKSSEVYGMNRVAFSRGHVDRQFSLDEVVGTLTVQIKRLWGKTLAPSA